MSAQPLPVSTPFTSLPLGSITPSDWLRDQLSLQAAGFTGHIGEVWPDLGDNSGWLGGSGEDWERGPYYCDGLIPLAYSLADARLTAMAERWVGWSLESQRPDGYFGPATNDDWWPRMVMLKTLTQYHEATGDSQVIPFLERYFAHQRRRLSERPLIKWGEARGAENVLTILWLYRRTGDSTLLDLAATVTLQTLDWGRFFVDFPIREKHTSGFDHLTHVVNVAMGVKEPVLRYLLTGDPAHREAFYAGLANLDRYHGQVTDMFSGDEWLAGREPTQGVELCAVVEFMFSLEQALPILGDARLADRLERVAYNNLPATITADMRGRQYDQQWNQVICTVGPRQWTDNGDESNIFGLSPNFGCCTANLHQGWPKLAASLWLRTHDGGLAAVVYGPCRVTATFGEAKVTIDEQTSYPFSDEIRLVVKTSAPSSFPLTLRVPGWCDRAVVRVNGEVQSGFDRPGFGTIRREWRDGDIVEVDLPVRVQTRPGQRGAISIQRGALTFALQVGERWQKLPERRPGAEPFADWEVYPTTPWNYALVLDPSRPENTLQLHRSTVGALPFSSASSPLQLRAKARLVPDWTMDGLSAGPTPPSPVRPSTPIEDVTLIPYGCARLRVTELPYCVE
jgi:uncharacterized protein